VVKEIHLNLHGLNKIWETSGGGHSALTPFRVPFSRLAHESLNFLGYLQLSQSAFRPLPQKHRSEHTLESTIQDPSSGTILGHIVLKHSQTNPMDQGLSLTLTLKNFDHSDDSRVRMSTGGWCSMPQPLEVKAWSLSEERFRGLLAIAREQFGVELDGAE
jgi:hypothetical protein